MGFEIKNNAWPDYSKCNDREWVIKNCMSNLNEWLQQSGFEVGNQSFLDAGIHPIDSSLRQLNQQNVENEEDYIYGAGAEEQFDVKAK